MNRPGAEYRLGDLVLGWMTRQHALHPRQYPSPDIVCTNWPASLACEYRKKCHVARQYACFCRLVHRRLARTLFLNSSVLVVHLRLGDVLDLPFYQFKGRSQLYVKPLDFYAHARLPPLLSEAHVVTNASFRAYFGHAHSVRYLRNVSAILSLRGLRTRIVTHDTPDDALLYMARARYFMPSGGGFSALATRLILSYNHTVVAHHASTAMYG